jgi:NAD(P)-dependent dehydrogenase (short-subunit alcohol dehydrogenase family)
VLVADLADGQAARGVVADVLEVAGDLEIVVHAAAICAPSSVLDLTEETWDRTLDVALRGTALNTIAAARHMRDRGRGNIVLITSIDAELVEPGLAHYSAAKAGLAAFGRCMAVELGPTGISVNSVAPGWVRTETAAPRLDRATPESLQRLNAVARPADPVEIANVVAYLAFDAPPYLTGTTITVDGGQSIKAAMP